MTLCFCAFGEISLSDRNVINVNYCKVKECMTASLGSTIIKLVTFKTSAYFHVITAEKEIFSDSCALQSKKRKKED